MPQSKPRFGLALSGGGFRASFFHIGVLRRLAELDLLQFVSTISTVSGGSLVGAHYYLLFKEKFEAEKGKLRRAHYIEMVDRLEAEFVRGNHADFRNRLFSSPVAHFRALAIGRSYGRPMARLYAKYLYGPVTWRLYRNEHYAGSGVPLHCGVILPRKILLTLPPGHHDVTHFPSSGYPGSAAAGQTLQEINEEEEDGSVIPRLIINATCLNTGGPFTFAMNEVGGPAIGYVRTDEVLMLIQYKMLIGRLQRSSFLAHEYHAAEAEALERGRELEERPELAKLPKTAFRKDRSPFPPHTAEHLRLYLAATERIQTHGRSNRQGMWHPGSWKSRALHHLSQVEAWPGVRRLMECDWGTLRAAKMEAWHLLDTLATRPVTSEVVQSHGQELLQMLERIHPDLHSLARLPARYIGQIAALILDLYYLRSADNIDWDAPEVLADLTLAHAVAASANFPPVFTPFRIHHLFSADRYAVVALTDGGVNDNQGTEAVAATDCDWLVASDAGGLVEAERDPADARLPMMDRIINVLMGGLRDAQLRTIHTSAPPAAPSPHRRGPHLRDPRKVHFHIADELRSESDEVPRQLVAQIRTDLDAFNEVERSVLIRRGYMLAHEHVPPSFFDAKSPFKADARPARAVRVPPRIRPTRHVLRILRGSALRAGRFSEAYPVVAACMAIAAALVLGLAGLDHFEALQTVLDDDLKARAAQIFGTGDLGVARWITSPWKKFVGWLRKESLLALAIAGWVVYLTARGVMRHVRSRRRSLAPMVDLTLARTAGFFSVFARWINVVTLVFLLLFLVGLRPKFLLGVLPLWCFPIAVSFAVIAALFTPLWRAAGSLSSRWPYRLWNSR